MSRRRRYDPLAPLDPVAQRRAARRYADASILPLIKAADVQAQRKTTQGTNAIGYGTQALRQSLEPYAGQTRQNYAQAEQAQAALNASLAQRLEGQGSQLSQSLAQQLAAINAPAGSNTAQQTAQGAANAGYATGSAGLTQLLASGAAAQNYASGLPAIAGIGGLQAANEYRAQIESARQQEVAQYRARYPGVYQQGLSDIQNREFQKATANLGFAGDVAKLGQQQSEFATSQETTRRGQDITRQNAQDRVAAQQAKDSASAAKASAKAAKSSANAKQKAFWSTRVKAFTQAAKLYGEGGGKDGGGLFGGTSSGGKHPSRSRAYSTLYATYGPYLHKSGWGESAIRTMLNKALTTAGYQPDYGPQTHTKRNWPH